MLLFRPFFLLLLLVALGSFAYASSVQISERTERIINSIASEKDPFKRLDLYLGHAEKSKLSRQMISLSDFAINLADSLRLVEKKAEALRWNGIGWKLWGDNVQSIRRLQASRELYEKLRNPRMQAILDREIGETYRAGGTYDLSAQSLLRSLRYFEQVEDSTEINEVFNRLAANYFERIFHWREIYENKLDFPPPAPFDPEIPALTNPGVRNAIDSLQYFLSRSIEYSSRKSMMTTLISSKIIEAAYLTLTGKFDEGLAKYLEIEALIEESEADIDLPLLYLNLSNLYSPRFKNQPHLTIYYAQKALSIAIEKDIRAYKNWANRVLHPSYVELGMFDSAYYYLNNTYQLQLEFYSENLRLRLNSQNQDFLIASREIDLAQQKKQFSLLVGFAIVLVVMFITFIAALQSKNKKQALLLKELKTKNEIISSQNEELRVINEQKDKFFSIIAHDLRSPFAGIHNLAELMKNDLEANKTEDLTSYTQMMLDASYQALELLANLMTWAKSQTGRIPFEPKELPLGKLLQSELAQWNQIAQAKHIRLLHSVSPDLSIYADAEMIKTVLRNLVDNALKFTRDGGEIEISAVKLGDQTLIKVKDSGMGMDEETLQKLFIPGAGIGRPGTNGEPSSGLGLLICKEFVDRHGGELNVSSVPEEGTTFELILPEK
jgi:signal transduction histidine kinase